MVCVHAGRMVVLFPAACLTGNPSLGRVIKLILGPRAVFNATIHSGAIKKMLETLSLADPCS